MTKKERTGTKSRHNTVWRLGFIFVVLLFAFTSCQRESEDITPVPPAEVISPESTVAGYIERIALMDGSFDNILDHGSCISIVLPVTVIVDGEEIWIDSADDYKIVERILDASENDDDSLAIVFPITIIQADHSERIIQDQEELENIAGKCTEGGHDDDIECLDFIYPLTFYVYDSSNQLSRTVTLLDDEELFGFFHDLDSTDLASFKFPIAVILSDGQEISVNNNDQLEDVIENVIDGCNEDDNDDHNDDDADDSDFIKVLLSGDWVITQYNDGSDQTDAFKELVFTFNADRTVISENGESTVQGTWETNGDDGTIELELNLGEASPYDKLDDDWNLVEFSSTVIKLRHLSEDDQSVTALVFEKK